MASIMTRAAFPSVAREGSPIAKSLPITLTTTRPASRRLSHAAVINSAAMSKPAGRAERIFMALSMPSVGAGRHR